MDATELQENLHRSISRLCTMLKELSEKTVGLEAKIGNLTSRCCCKKDESINGPSDAIKQKDISDEDQNSREETKEIADKVISQPKDLCTIDNSHVVGHHELEISEGGEADLHKHMSECKKNPDHLQLIPVHQFKLDHLLSGYRDTHLYDLIKAVADLTVRISVKMTSERRPQFWPNTTLPYSLSDKKGSKNLRTGSGRVIGLVKNEDEQCSCSNCQSLDRARSSWKIKLVTAAHVVFDDIEASQTRVRLFFDSDDSPKVVFDRVNLINVNIERDICRLDYNTCDISLVEKLDHMCKRYTDVRKKVFDKYNATRDEDKLMFIVSHPHGCSKRISIGRWKDKKSILHLGSKNQFTYTTCTCPGSSGASVHCVGYDMSYDKYWYVHSGCSSGVNNSSVD
uniref:Peptidase S1 domain-containing protein n=1 Tax=Biomphalaria glabrata TaxID=6526 RepID=A0A2C9KQ21_BIOGL